MQLSQEIVKGSLKFIILSILLSQDEYGYSLAQKIRHKSDDLVKAGEGSLYPALYKLEAEKLITSYWDATSTPKRKFYAITDKGKKLLISEAPKIAQFRKLLSLFLAPELKAIYA